MKTKLQTDRLKNVILPRDETNGVPGQELGAMTAGGCADQKETIMQLDGIIGRVQEYAQPVRIATEEPTISGVTQPSAISKAQPALKELFDLKAGSPVATLREAIWAIQRFRADFPTLLKPSDDMDIKHITWRISQHPQDWLAWYKIPNRNSAYSMKSKLRRYLANLIHARITRLEESIKQNSEISRLAGEQATLIYSYILLATDHGIFDVHSRDEIGRWREWHTKNATSVYRKKTNKSNKYKRQTPNHLPAGWQETIAQEMGYNPTIDLYICCGSRPSETKSATLLLVDQSQLAITILGSKLSDISGQKYRTICPNMLIPAARRLAAAIGDLDFSNVNLNALRARMGRASRKLWGITVSPMCFRHSLAGQIKEIDGPLGHRVTETLGHKSSRTGCGYGTRTGKALTTQRNTFDPVVSVSVSQAIRETRSSKYRAQKAKRNRTPAARCKSAENDKS